MIRLISSLFVVSQALALSDYLYALYGCNPPSSLRARIELIGFDSDRDFNGVMTNADFAIDLMDYDYDGNVTQVHEWETAFHWRCRYGFEEGFGRYFHNLFAGSDGILTLDDFNPGISVNGDDFKRGDLRRFRTYCMETNNQSHDCRKLQTEAHTLIDFSRFSLPESDYAGVRS